MTRLEELAQQLRMLRDAGSPDIHPVALAALIEVSAATTDILDALDMRRATPSAEPVAPPAVAEDDRLTALDGAWCQPGDQQDKRRWLLAFDDHHRKWLWFDDEGEARAKFASENTSWNCWLLAAAPLHPLATARPAAQAVTDEMKEEIKRVLARWHRNSCYPEAMDIDLDLGVDLLAAALSARQEGG